MILVLKFVSGKNIGLTVNGIFNVNVYLPI